MFTLAVQISAPKSVSALFLALRQKAGGVRCSGDHLDSRSDIHNNSGCSEHRRRQWKLCPLGCLRYIRCRENSDITEPVHHLSVAIDDNGFLLFEDRLRAKTQGCSTRCCARFYTVVHAVVRTTTKKQHKSPKFAPPPTRHPSVNNDKNWQRLLLQRPPTITFCNERLKFLSQDYRAWLRHGHPSNEYQNWLQYLQHGKSLPHIMWNFTLLSFPVPKGWLIGSLR